jgi:transcriptional regulator with XRE-family HTH domain
MQAITRLETSGLTVPQIAREAGVDAPAVRRWKRGETSPNPAARERLVALALTRGVALMWTDFTREPKAKAGQSQNDS